MESLLQVQNLVVEHAYIIGIGLLIAVVISGIAWYWISRGSAKNSVLENQARVNNVDLESHMSDVPSSALAPETHDQQSSGDNDQINQEMSNTD